MLSPRQIIFAAVDDILIHATGRSWQAIADTDEVLVQRGAPLVLSSRGTRAQLQPLRRKIEHGHPFLTESGGGLFIPDGYFNLHLEGATRVGRNFCVPFARPNAEAVSVLPEIASEAGASVVGFSQMSVREIARNSGLSVDDAEMFRQREFSEIFFFAGETEEATRRFREVAKEKGWEAVPGEPFWELRAPLKRAANAIQHLMGIYRKALHGRQRSVGIGSRIDDSYLLSATDAAVIVPLHRDDFDEALVNRLPRATRAEQSGAAGWAQVVMDLLGKP